MDNPAAAIFWGPRGLYLGAELLTGALRLADRFLPRAVLDGLISCGIVVVMLAAPGPRRNSRGYLAAVLGRPPSGREIWRHYRAFTEMHLLRVRVAEGRPHRFEALPGCEDFTALMASRRPALLGTFHLGNSDLLGFVLGQFQRHVFMVRYRLGDPRLLRRLGERMRAWVTFVWVNERENVLFALKEALQRGGSIAMKCDAVGDSAKPEGFQFLGARRSFPLIIYHLAILFRRPVTFCISVPDGPDASRVQGFPVFEPDDGSKEENLRRARAHFQDVLTKIEALLRKNPYLWFSFSPLNPELTAAVSPPQIDPALAPVVVRSSATRPAY